jgi:hypothetical protein
MKGGGRLFEKKIVSDKLLTNIMGVFGHIWRKSLSGTSKGLLFKLVVDVLHHHDQPDVQGHLMFSKFELPTRFALELCDMRISNVMDIVTNLTDLRENL